MKLIKSFHEVTGIPALLNVLFESSGIQVEPLDIVSSSLIPTQNQLDPVKSILKFLTKPEVTKNLLTHDPIMIKKPIVTYNGKYILDGHHAWAEAVIVRPNDQISCINLVGEISPLDIISKIKTALSQFGMEDAQNRGVKSELNLYRMTEEEARSYFERNMSDECFDIMLEYGIPEPIEHLVRGVMQMQERNVPISGALPRTEMPQFGKRNQRYDAMNRLRSSSGESD